METNEINGLENIEGIEKQNEGNFHALRYFTLSLTHTDSLSHTHTHTQSKR
jgi:hypothetical protein